MEEQKKSYWFLLPMFIGVVVGIFGITLIIGGAKSYVPPMSSSGWFEASSARSSTIMGGVVLTFIGFFVIGIIVSIIVYTFTNQAIIAQKNLGNNQMLNVAMNKTMPNIFVTPAQPVKNEVVCSYCGETYDANKLAKCPGCGARRPKK